MLKSATSVFLGVLLAFLIALLVVFGIFAPVLSVVFGLGELTASNALPLTLMVFAAAVSFYFGGMAAGYRAPNRRSLHGALVGVAAFAVSPAVNLAAGEGPFPRIDTFGAVLLLCLVFVVSVGAGYVGGRRGAALYDYNRRYARRPPKKTRKSDSETR